MGQNNADTGQKFASIIHFKDLGQVVFTMGRPQSKMLLTINEI